jgi:anti-sigma B factor antagonist
MDIKIEEMKRCEVVHVSGRVDSSAGAELQEKLLGEIEAGQKNLVVSLGGLEYISSAGLKALLAALIRTRRRFPSGDVVIAELPAAVRETFELVGLTQLFKMYDSDLEAVGSF